MFTGIVEELGTLKSIKRSSTDFILEIAAPLITADLAIGDSVAVNGICLTVTMKGKEMFAVDVMPETLNNTNLQKLKPGSSVNLERALTMSSRLGGHLVSGHVDGVGIIKSKKEDSNAVVVQIKAPESVTRYLIDRGSITVDGISLTVMGLAADAITVSLIPHTAKITTLGQKKKGDTVNLEADLIGKYVEKFVSVERGSSENKVSASRMKSEKKEKKLTAEKLGEMGFL
jgi:riboflavin synthase